MHRVYWAIQKHTDTFCMNQKKTGEIQTGCKNVIWAICSTSDKIRWDNGGLHRITIVTMEINTKVTWYNILKIAQLKRFRISVFSFKTTFLCMWLFWIKTAVSLSESFIKVKYITVTVVCLILQKIRVNGWMRSHKRWRINICNLLHKFSHL